MRRTRLGMLILFSCVLAPAAFAQAQTATGSSCEALAQLKLPNTKILAAKTVAAGAFAPPVAPSSAPGMEDALYKALPAFCRVTTEATPSADSSIQIEVWMPVKGATGAGWNGKFRGLGNGGFAGQIFFPSLAQAVSQGYAAAGTDTGHVGGVIDARWALGHPEKITDFGYRAIHEMTRVARGVLHSYYGSEPQHSYFSGCSNGGRQALMEAQRYPEDYDGILAGAPANFWTHLLSSTVFDAQALMHDAASYIPASKIPAIALAVNTSCDALDGVSDGILNDPRKCHFDPERLLCKAGDSDSCLTAPQVATLKKLYQGARDSAGKEIFPGFLPGAEEGGNGWRTWIMGTAPGRSFLFAFGAGFFANMVYNNANWDIADANLDQAVHLADDKTASVLNATDPNLKAFRARGGKLILYHGWNDPGIAALNTVAYFESVRARMGPQETDSFVRLYMVPGMQHCGGGPGTDSFGQSGGIESADGKDPQHNIQLSLEHWVESGAAPAAIIAAKNPGGTPAGGAPTAGAKLTRPLCPYPQAAEYKSGDSNDAASFVCSLGATPPKKP